MEFYIKECTLVIIIIIIIIIIKAKQSKRRELFNQESIRKLGEKLQIPGNIRSGYHQVNGYEKKVRKEYFRRTRKLFETNSAVDIY